MGFFYLIIAMASFSEFDGPKVAQAAPSVPDSGKKEEGYFYN